MPNKTIELTFKLCVDKVSCPGVWLCQEGMVSLTVYALGMSYQTCMLPPVFPLMFKDVFYFRRLFPESCTMSSIFCLLRDETIYCELLQWNITCMGQGKCTLLAQYLGALNDVLFPPLLCSNDGVDLLMRRSKNFPGILAPKIEISTKVRIDEVYNAPEVIPPRTPRLTPCACRKPDTDPARTKQVCHTPQYHRCRHKAATGRGSSCTVHMPETAYGPPKISQVSTSYQSDKRMQGDIYRQYYAYNVGTPAVEETWMNVTNKSSNAGDRDSDWEDYTRTQLDGVYHDQSNDKTALEVVEDWNDASNHNTITRLMLDDKLEGNPRSQHSCTAKSSQRLILESRFTDSECRENCHPKLVKSTPSLTPCLCEICRSYHRLFHDKS